jgi:hypothetical protein
LTEHVYLEEDEVVRRAVEALVRDLGPVEAMRFLSLHREQHLDSVAQHRQWQDRLDKERFFDEVFHVNRVDE